MSNTIRNIATGVAGIVGEHTLLQVTPDPENIQSIIGLLGQVIIALVTVWSLVKRKKTANETAKDHDNLTN